MNPLQFSLMSITVALVVLPVIAEAEPLPMHTPARAEFAMQLPLTVSGENGVVQMLLPIEVYQHSRSAELADGRVFNYTGEVLP